MTHDELTTVIDATFDEIRRLRTTKGKDYSRGEEDTLSNFKRHAEALDITPFHVWAVYASKHWDAIMSFCKYGQVESEPIDGRIDDALTYLLLLKGLIEDERKAREAEER
jgi:hypothetical protein